MKDITDTVNDVCMVRHIFLRDKLCHKVAHAHVHNYSNSNVNTCTGAILWQSLSHKYSAVCLVQIGAHHHMDVCTDINKLKLNN